MPDPEDITFKIIKFLDRSEIFMVMEHNIKTISIKDVQHCQSPSNVRIPTGGNLILFSVLYI